MDQHKKAIIEKSIFRTMENLQKNNMQAYYIESKDLVVPKVKELLNPGDTICTGGSMTLEETNVMELLRSGEYNFLEGGDANRKAFFADAYLCSSNAITENGELYNIDANSNRVAAIIFGPKSVIIVAGYNKIVRNMDEAVIRLRTVATPSNCVRLNRDTYCAHNGHCVALNSDKSQIADGCRSQQRICSNYVISGMQIHKDRIKVIIVGEEIGY